MTLIISTKISSAEIDFNGAFEIDYKGKLGFFVPPDMFRLYNKLLTNYPSLEEENDELRDWLVKKDELFKESIDEYFKLRKMIAVSIGISVGCGFAVLGMLFGIIVYAVLNYNRQIY